MNKAKLKNILNNHPQIEWSKNDPDAFYFSGTYHLSHGEYERPTYTIARYKDGYGIKVMYFYFDGTYDAPRNGKLDEITLNYLLNTCHYNAEKN